MTDSARMAEQLAAALSYLAKQADVPAIRDIAGENGTNSFELVDNFSDQRFRVTVEAVR